MMIKKIRFHDLDVKSGLTKRTILKSFLISMIKLERYKVEKVDFIFCKDEYLLELNQRHLKHNYYTDTMTFLFSQRGEPLQGEIYISIDRIKENAKTYRVSYSDELIRVIIHSCLHLCGYKDDTPRLKKSMTNVQEKYLQQWYVSRGT